MILLVSPAFGRPNSDRDVGAQIGNKLDDIRHFSNETGKMLRNSSLTMEVIKMLLEAEQTILKMTAELKTLQTEEMKFKDNYFPNFNKAKAYLRRTRQGLYSAVGATTVGLIIAAVFGCLGLCSAVGAVASGSTAAATEKEVAIVIKKIEKLKF